MVQEPEDVDKYFVRDPGYGYGLRFFLVLECEGLRKALDNLGYKTLPDGTRVVCTL